ncbi:hypothetical protein LCGC14_2997420, partial [marine sediment metagenome]
AGPLTAAPPEILRTADGQIRIVVTRYGGAVYFSVITLETDQTFTLGVVPPDTPDPPADEALTSYVRSLTEKVKAKDHDALSQVFFRIAGEIDAGTYTQATPIGDRTVELIFGPEKDLRPAWAEWWNTLNVHLLRKRGFDTPDKWAAAYRVIGKAVKP